MSQHNCSPVLTGEHRHRHIVGDIDRHGGERLTGTQVADRFHVPGPDQATLSINVSYGQSQSVPESAGPQLEPADLVVTP